MKGLKATTMAMAAAEEEGANMMSGAIKEMKLMKRILLMATTMTLMVLVVGGVALAANIVGTSRDD
jgi:hypothetical protein